MCAAVFLGTALFQPAVHAVIGVGERLGLEGFKECDFLAAG